MKYKVSTYAKIHGVTMRTVWNWINKGELEIERTSTGRIRIVVDENKEKTIAVYDSFSSEFESVLSSKEWVSDVNNEHL